MPPGGVRSTPGRVASVVVAISRASRVCNPWVLSVAMVVSFPWLRGLYRHASGLGGLGLGERQGEDTVDVRRFDASAIERCRKRHAAAERALGPLLPMVAHPFLLGGLARAGDGDGLMNHRDVELGGVDPGDQCAHVVVIPI